MSHLAVAASLEAVEQAGLDIDRGELEPAAVVVANAHGDWYVTTDMILRGNVLEGDAPPELTPDMWGRLLYHAPCNLVAQRLKATGPTFTYSSACVSGAKSIERAVRWHDGKRLMQLDCHLNDPAFAEAAVRAFHEIAA